VTVNTPICIPHHRDQPAPSNPVDQKFRVVQEIEEHTQCGDSAESFAFSYKSRSWGISVAKKHLRRANCRNRKMKFHLKRQARPKDQQRNSEYRTKEISDGKVKR